MPRPKKDDSAEVYIGEEFIGVLFVDDEDTTAPSSSRWRSWKKTWWSEPPLSSRPSAQLRTGAGTHSRRCKLLHQAGATASPK